MIQGRSVLAVIPARGGSKRLPGKNLRPLSGRPLIAWTIEAAHRSRLVDHTVLSSEDETIRRAAREIGCAVPFDRPEELATDTASSIDTVLHALDALEESYDWVVLLQPTSPLRTSEDIDACVALAHGAGANACVSLVEPATSPWLSFGLDAAGRLEPLLALESWHVRSQDLPRAWAINGAVYAARVPWLRESKRFIGPETLGYVMPRERSVDVDTDLDLALAQALVERG